MIKYYNGDSIDIELTKLRKHEMNTNIYGELEDIEAFARDISQFGLQKPIEVIGLGNEIYKVISGHRRVAAHKALGRESIQAIIVQFESKQEEINYLVLSNRYRTKTKSQVIKEAAILYETLKEEGGHGRALEKVALMTETSVGTLHNGIAVIKTAEELKKTGKNDKAQQLIEIMDRQGVNASVKKMNDILGNEDKKKETEWNMDGAVAHIFKQFRSACNNMKVERNKFKTWPLSSELLFKACEEFGQFIRSYRKQNGNNCPKCGGAGFKIETDKTIKCDYCFEGKVGNDEY